MRIGRTLRRVVILGMVALLAACAASVALHDNKKLVDKPYKLTSVQLAYQATEWEQSKASLGVSANGFVGFGSHVVKVAQTFLPSKGLELVSADVIRHGASINVSRKSANDPLHAFAVLRIAPTKGELRTGTTTRGGNYEASSLEANYEFRVELFDLGMQKPVWQATMNTKTMTASSKENPRDKGSYYDDELAQKVLETIVAKLKDDGLM